MHARHLCVDHCLSCIKRRKGVRVIRDPFTAFREFSAIRSWGPADSVDVCVRSCSSGHEKPGCNPKRY